MCYWSKNNPLVSIISEKASHSHIFFFLSRLSISRRKHFPNYTSCTQSIFRTITFQASIAAFLSIYCPFGSSISPIIIWKRLNRQRLAKFQRFFQSIWAIIVWNASNAERLVDYPRSDRLIWRIINWAKYLLCRFRWTICIWLITKSTKFGVDLPGRSWIRLFISI